MKSVIRDIDFVVFEKIGFLSILWVIICSKYHSRHYTLSIDSESLMKLPWKHKHFCLKGICNHISYVVQNQDWSLHNVTLIWICFLHNPEMEMEDYWGPSFLLQIYTSLLDCVLLVGCVFKVVSSLTCRLINSFSLSVQTLPCRGLTENQRCTRWFRRTKNRVRLLANPTPSRCCRRCWKLMRKVCKTA